MRSKPRSCRPFFKKATAVTAACALSLALTPAYAFADESVSAADGTTATDTSTPGDATGSDTTAGTDDATAAPGTDTSDGTASGDTTGGDSSEGEDTGDEDQPVSIEGAKVKLSASYVAYKGTDTAVPKVKSVTLVDGTVLDAANYTVKVGSKKAKAGTNTITVTGTGDYTGKASATYNIYKATLTYNNNGSSYAKEGKTCGTTSGSTALKKIRIKTTLKGLTGSVKYKANIVGSGWTAYVADGKKVKAGNIQAVRIKLTGKLAKYYDVYYRVNVQELGWLGWAKNTASAGSTDMHLAARGYQVKLVLKDGGSAPSQSKYAFVNKKNNYVAAVNTMLDATAKKTSANSKYLILVSRTYNRLNIYQKSNGSWKRIKAWICSTGKKSTPSLSGTFTVGSRGFSFDTSGNDGTCYYYTQWCGNYLFHSVIYKLHDYNTIKSSNQLGKNISHGCVRLDRANAKWIYDNIPSGTKVKVFGTVY